MTRFYDGDVVTNDAMFVVKGHLSLDEYNEIADEWGEPPATALRHYYARCIPAPRGDENNGSYIHDWGNKPSRGAFPVTEAIACEEVE